MAQNEPDQPTRRPGEVADRLRRLAAEVAQLPVVDRRPADEILGYGPAGVFERHEVDSEDPSDA